MARRGRHTKAYAAAEGDIAGLYRIPGTDRWRITLKGPHFGKRFTEADERLAIQHFRNLTAQDRPTVSLHLATVPSDALAPDGQYAPPTAAEIALAGAVDSILAKNGQISFIQRVDESAMWNWCRERIIADPIAAAARLGIAKIASLHDLPNPSAPITLTALAALYADKSESTANTRSHIKSALKRLRTVTGAETLNDLNTDALLAFRDAIVKDYAPSGASAVFGKVKSALAFALKEGLDAAQLNAVLGRTKVLTAPRSTAKANPTPISPANFRTLLQAADTHWRAMLLLGLNLAMYCEDLCGLRWDDFDLDAKTYVGRRAKTQVVRVGVLWAETVAALQALPRTAASPFVFTSSTGDRYLSHTQYDLYLKFRRKAGVDAQFSSLRDAAYTIACRSCEDRISRVFAGHRMAGLMDSYIARNPAWVRPASDAVYAAYSPFPLSPTP